jgi:phage terminase large subunit-like protein
MARKKRPDKKFWQYIDDVESGRAITGEPVKLSVSRFLNDIKAKNFEFDFDRGERVVNFIEKYCRHWKGDYAGKPFLFQPHQHFHFINLFGWIRADGTRRFRSSYKEVARKNAKTTEGALGAIFHICKDNEQGAQVYAGATKEAQAMIVVNDAGQIIKRSPALAKRFKLFDRQGDIRRVVYPSTSSIITPIGRDSKTQDGFDPSMALIDEYHAHPTAHTRGVIESGMGSRSQPMSTIFTTAGANKQGPCYKLRHTGIQILKGILKDDSFFINIHTLDFKEKGGDDWMNPEAWVKANPNMGTSVKMANMLDAFTKAKNEGGETEVEFKTKNINMWTDSAGVWVPDELYMKNHHGTRATEMAGLLCYAGLDLASTTDINALILFFPEFREVNGKKISAILPFFYIPEDNVDIMSRRDQVDYRAWVDAGYITTTPGNITDYNFIERDVIAFRQIYGFKSLAFDPWNAGNIIGDLSNEGVECHEMRQGFSSLSNPSKLFERMARSGQFEHFNNPVMRWMAGNVTLDRDAASNIKPNKAKSVNKIDGISATINAIGEWMTMKNEPEKIPGMIII